VAEQEPRLPCSGPDVPVTAPAATLTARIIEQIATVLAAHAAPHEIIEEELRRIRVCRLAKTANRSVVGIMTEFAHLAEIHRHHNFDQDLLNLALRLATTPCGPLHRSTVSPDRELHALLQSIKI
jgi:uncharacterized protein DUF6933